MAVLIWAREIQAVLSGTCHASKWDLQTKDVGEFGKIRSGSRCHMASRLLVQKKARLLIGTVLAVAWAADPQLGKN